MVGLFVVIGLWYMLSARKWFTGPKVQGSPEELAAIEAELEGVKGNDPSRGAVRSGRASRVS